MRVPHLLLTTLGLTAMTVLFGCSRESSVKENVNLKNNHSRVFVFNKPIEDPQAFADSMANTLSTDTIPDTLTVTINDSVYMIGILPYNIEKIYRFQWTLTKNDGKDTIIISNNSKPQAWAYGKPGLYEPKFVAFDGNNATDTAGIVTRKAWVNVIDTKPRLSVPKDTIWTKHNGDITFPILASDSFGTIVSLKVDLDASGKKDSAKVYTYKEVEGTDTLYLTIKNDASKMDSLGNQKIYIIVTDDDNNETIDSVNLHFNRKPKLKILYPLDGTRHNINDRFYFYYEAEDLDNPLNLQYFIYAQAVKNARPPERAFTQSDLIASEFTSNIFEPPTDKDGRPNITLISDGSKLTGRIYWDMFVTDGYDTVYMDRISTGDGTSRPWNFYIGELSANNGTISGTAKYQGRTKHDSIYVKFTDITGSKIFDAYTDANGYYEVKVDLGTYIGTVSPNSTIKEYNTITIKDTLFIDAGSLIANEPVELKDTVKPYLHIKNTDTLATSRKYAQTIFARDIGSSLKSVAVSIDSKSFTLPSKCKMQEENTVFNCEFETESLSDGTHEIVYKAEDNAGNTRTLKQSFSIMATKVTLDVNGLKNARIGENGTLTFTATVSDAVPAPKTINWSWTNKNGDKVTKQTNVDENGHSTITYTYDELKGIANASDEYLMTVSYTENGANATASVKFGLLGENPTIIFKDHVFDDTISINDPVHLQIEAFKGSESTSLNVTWQCDELSKISTGYSCPAANAEKADISYKAAGTYKITATVTDNDDKVGTSTINIVVLKDPPSLEVSTRDNSNEYKINSVVTVYATAGDKFGTVNTIKWGCSNGKVSFDKTLDLTESASNSVETSLTVTLPGSETSNYKCVFKAIDDDGEEGLDSLTFATLVDRPTVSLATKKDTVKISSTQTLKAIAKDKLGYIKTYEYACNSNLANLKTPQWLQMSGPEQKVTMPNSATNAYYCVVQVKDDDGNDARDTVTYKVVVGRPTVKAFVNYNKATIKDVVELNAHATDSLGSIIKYEWGCGTSSAVNISFNHVDQNTAKWNYTLPSTPQNGHKCIIRVTDDDKNTAMDSVSIDIVLAPPTVEVTKKSLTVRAGYNIALNAEAYDNNNLPSDPGSITKREWSCGTPSEIAKNWKQVSDYDTIWKAPSTVQQPFYCVARATDNDDNTDLDTINILFSTDKPLIWVKDELIYINTGDRFELDASVNNVWQGIDWFTWECKDKASGKTLESKVTKYDYAANGNAFRIGKDSTYSTKADSMNCIVSAQETSTKATFSDTTVVRRMKKLPTGVISAADTVYLWSGDEAVEDEAVYYYSKEWGGQNSTLGDLGNKNKRDFYWKFSNVDGNFYQGNADGSIDTTIAEFNTAFIRRTREGSVTITLDFRDSISETPTLSFYNRHRAKEVSHKVYFAKAWKNIGKDTVIASTSANIIPDFAIVDNLPIIAYAESMTKIVLSKSNSTGTSWSSLGSVTASSVKKLSAVAHGSDFYVGIVDNNGLTVYKSSNGTSPPAKVGSTISGIKDVKLISNGSGNPHAIVINSNNRIAMYDFNGSAWSTNSKFGTMENGSFSNFDAAINSNGLVVVGVTSDYKLYYGLFSNSDFTSRTKAMIASEVGMAKIALNGSKTYTVYFNRNQNSNGPHIATGTISGSSISWGTGSLIRDGIVYNISLAVKDNGVVYAAFDNRSAVSQIDVYRYESGKWHLHGENQLPYFNSVFYERNKYYLRGLYPVLAFDKNGKLYLSMLAQESSTGSGKNNGPIVMKYVADNWKIQDWK